METNFIEAINAATMLTSYYVKMMSKTRNSRIRKKKKKDLFMKDFHGLANGNEKKIEAKELAA